MTNLKPKPHRISSRGLRPALISFVALLAAALLPGGHVHGATQDKKVSISLQNVGYEKVFDEITKQAGYTFLYNNAQLDHNSRVSVNEKESAVSHVLDKLFAGKGLAYSMMGNQIVITPNQSPQKNKNGRYDITVKIVDKDTKKALSGVYCRLPNLGIFAGTGADGKALLKDVPGGENNIEIRLLGYSTLNAVIQAGQGREFSFEMEEVSYAMQNVEVLGRRTVNSLSTSTTIERQAIDHIQAMSLGDLMELLPGQALRNNRSMTSPEQLRFRTLQSDKNNAFGAAVIMDGMQLSNNASLEGLTSGGLSTAGEGIDLRAISTDDIDFIEVIQGIPSVEYGDLTSGAMIVKTNVGSSPLRLRVKVSPGIWQTSANKGWRLDKNNTVNMSFDYTFSGDDPRNKASSFDRINASLGYGANITKDWRTNTRFRMSSMIDWRGNDPDVVADGTSSKSKNYNFSLSHDGKISVDRLLSRTVAYNFGAQYSQIDQFQTRYELTGQSIFPLFDATETGLHEATILLPSSYLTSGGTKSRPFSFNAKVSNNFYINTDELNQRFNMGVQYSYEKNFGQGNYNTDSSLPFHSNLARERLFKDVPGIHHIAAYFEDNIETTIFGRKLKVQAGVRFTGIQPFKDEFVYGISPRVNMNYDATEWLSVRGSFGKTAKTPGLTHLYPENSYRDHRIVSYLPNSAAERLVMYYTNVTEYAYSKGLKNSTATRWGAGFDIKFSDDINLSVDAYRDYNPNGFSGKFGYTGYYLRTYDVDKGITPVAGQQPVLDFLEPGYTGPFDKEGIVWNTLGMAGNYSHSLDQGIEFSLDLGRIDAINTNVTFSGAYMESKLWNTDRDFERPVGDKPTLGTVDTPQFRLEYPSGNSIDVDKRLLSTMRLVYHIPQLRMVVSGAFQVTWLTYAKTVYKNTAVNPIGYMKFDYVGGEVVESYTPITEAMLADPEYRIDGVLLRDQMFSLIDKRSTIQPPLFEFNMRLTKNFAERAALSFYVNNASYYQPWLRSSNSKTRTERNSNISFGFELSFTF